MYTKENKEEEAQAMEDYWYIYIILLLLKQKTGSHRKFWELWAQMPLKHTQFQAPGLIWELKSSNL